METGETGETAKRDRLVAVVLCLGLFAVYAALRQEGHWSDGRALTEKVAQGRWEYHHALYLPLAGLVHRVSGYDPKLVLSLLSAFAAALAVALGFRAGRTLGASTPNALVGALLLATAPGVWFFATCVEVHALQLAAAAGTALWGASALRRGTFGESALGPALLLVALTGFHITGVLWAPALVLVAARGTGAWRTPRRLVPALVALALFGAFWLWSNAGVQTGPGRASIGLRRLLDPWRLALVWREVLQPAFGLYLLALPALFLRATPQARSRVAIVAVVVLFVCFLPFAFTTPIAERGGYYLSLVPVVALFAACGLERLGRAALPIAALVIAGQVWWSTAEVRRWEHEFPGHEWATPLFEEMGGQGIVLAETRQQFEAIWFHSDLTPYALRAERSPDELPPLLMRLEGIVERTRSNGRPVALMSGFATSEIPVVREFMAGLVARYGEPVPGRRPEYLLLP